MTIIKNSVVFSFKKVILERQQKLLTLYLYHNDFTSIINIYFYETFSTPNLILKRAHASLFSHPV